MQNEVPPVMPAKRVRAIQPQREARRRRRRPRRMAPRNTTVHAHMQTPHTPHTHRARQLNNEVVSEECRLTPQHVQNCLIQTRKLKVPTIAHTTNTHTVMQHAHKRVRMRMRLQ